MEHDNKFLTTYLVCLTDGGDPHSPHWMVSLTEQEARENIDRLKAFYDADPNAWISYDEGDSFSLINDNVWVVLYKALAPIPEHMRSSFIIET